MQMQRWQRFTGKAGYGGVFALRGKERPSAIDSSENPRAEQQEAEGGKGQASRIRHTLTEEVIHLHTHGLLIDLRYLI